jgi:hypothetical protein
VVRDPRLVRFAKEALLGLLLFIGIYDPIQYLLQERAPLQWTTMPISWEHAMHHVALGLFVWLSVAFVVRDLRRTKPVRGGRSKAETSSRSG